MNEVFNFSVDKLYDLLFTTSPFLRDFMEQRRFSGVFCGAEPFPSRPPPMVPFSSGHLMLEAPAVLPYKGQSYLSACLSSSCPVLCSVTPCPAVYSPWPGFHSLGSQCLLQGGSTHSR